MLPGHRQDREAAGDRQPRRGHRRPSTASWSPAATSAWSARSRTCRSCRRDHRQGPPQRQAGHRRHPDARVDDLQPLADPRRGLRRRQRDARRRRRGDAVRRDRRGGVPRPHRRDDGPDHHLDRGPRVRAAEVGTCARSTGTRAPAAASSPRRPARWPSGSARSTSSRSPSPATPPGGCRGSAGRIPMLAFTPEAKIRSQLALSLGRRDVQDRLRRAHRRDGAPGRRAAARDRPASRRATSWSSSPGRLRASRARPTRCACTGWATPINEVAPAYRRAPPERQAAHGGGRERSGCRSRDTGRVRDRLPLRRLGPEPAVGSTASSRNCVRTGSESNPHCMRFETLAVGVRGDDDSRRSESLRDLASRVDYSFGREHRRLGAASNERALANARAAATEAQRRRVERAEVAQAVAELTAAYAVSAGASSAPAGGHEMSVRARAR